MRALERGVVGGVAEVINLVVQVHAWPARAQPRCGECQGSADACQRISRGTANGDGGGCFHGRIVAALRTGVLHDCDHALWP
jgi:hypothetical protein